MRGFSLDPGPSTLDPYPVFDSSQSTGFLVTQPAHGWRIERSNVPRIAPETDSELPYPFVLAVFAVKSQRPFCEGPSFFQRKESSVYWTKVQ